MHKIIKLVDLLQRGWRVSALLVAGAVAAGAPVRAQSCPGNIDSAAATKFTALALVCPGGATPVPLAASIDAADLPTQSVRISWPRRAEPVRVQPVALRSADYDSRVALVRAVASRYRIDPHLLAAIVHAESRGRRGAVSPKGALGLMQVMPGTARELGITDPRELLRDEELALVTGARYLKRLQAQFGNDVEIVLAAYNAGPGAVRKSGRAIPPYRETRRYVRSIMDDYRAALAAGQ
jgi:soluble lytic murein transglycosylase-like protein